MALIHHWMQVNHHHLPLLNAVKDVRRTVLSLLLCSPINKWMTSLLMVLDVTLLVKVHQRQTQAAKSRCKICFATVCSCFFCPLARVECNWQEVNIHRCGYGVFLYVPWNRKSNNHLFSCICSRLPAQPIYNCFCHWLLLQINTDIKCGLTNKFSSNKTICAICNCPKKYINTSDLMPISAGKSLMWLRQG